MKETITVIGGGNIGTQFACMFAHHGYQVTLYTTNARLFSYELEICNDMSDIQYRGKIATITSHIEEAMKADIIFITYPAFLFEHLNSLILPYIHEGVKLVFVPGTGGVEFIFQNCRKKGALIYGLQRVPAVARLYEYGKRVCVCGQRKHLYLGTLGNTSLEEIRQLLCTVFEIDCFCLPNYLCVTMTPSNPILHTSRLATMFDQYKDGIYYPDNPLFYGEWSDRSSARLLACDREHQTLLKSINGLDLSPVKSLVDHYNKSDTIEKMTQKLRSIPSLHNLHSPMKLCSKGWIPDFGSRYFRADFPYGLAIIEDIARIAHTDLPNITKTMNWYRNTVDTRNLFTLKDYQIDTLHDLIALYL